MDNPTFLKLLISKGLLNSEAVRQLREKYRQDAFAILKHLAQTSPLNKTMLGRLWGDSIGISYVDLQKTLFHGEVLELLPSSFAKEHHIVLLYQFGEALTAAMANPLNHFVLKDAERIAGKPINPVFSFPDDIESAIEVEYSSQGQLQNLSRKIVTDSILIEDIRELTKEDLQKAAGSKSVVEFVHGLLLLAVKQGASDIHIEPAE